MTAMTALAAGLPTAHAEELVSASGPVTLESLAKLDHPWGMAYLPDDRLLITEKTGSLRIYTDEQVSEPLEGVPDVEFQGQGGLLDVAVDPEFEQNGYIYLSYVERADEQPDVESFDADPRLGPFVNEQDTVVKGLAVVRAILEEDALADVDVIWRQLPKTMGLGHYGGRLLFDDTGHLLISSGERQRFEPAQNLDNNLGAIIRINTDGSIPEDNPFVQESSGTSTTVSQDVWSWGHRNPLGMALHPETRELWIHEMGPLHGDEINIITAGSNYGWPAFSNGDHYNRVPIPDHQPHNEIVNPAYYWYPAISPSGMTFYEGDLFSDWSGSVFVGGLSAQTLVRLELLEDGSAVKSEERLDINRRIRDVETATDGAVLLLSDGAEGELLRLSPAESSGS
jgi:glucose/arabinose dehydrogenase